MMQPFFSLRTGAGQVWRRCLFMRLLAIGLGGMLFYGPASAQNTWPSIALPKSADAFGVGEQITANGMPMRIQGFVSQKSPAELLDWFRQSLGKPLVENTLGNKQILGRAEGRFYLTVQVEAAGRGSKGMAAVTDLKAAVQAQEKTQDNNARWLNRLPSGSKIISQISSQDGDKTSTQLVISNGYSETLNANAIKDIMARDGQQLEREVTPDEQTLSRMPARFRNGKTLLFKGAGKEAVATIGRDGNGSTSIVLSIVTQMESYK
ncbi:hypothetical protein BCF11_1835 [Collimonas sp. PA-H2]|uniref:hypothetical protein n=1 Tax=Collimonas sp. PA-H2 TaxID=1881062 RepID=UPI000C015D89|nr:hypothetical protein [Collimonas sp. PA-H2]PFH09439.1 hypothetical protein BCF11_1835 [Collimonas sp. PA-H2]